MGSIYEKNLELLALSFVESRMNKSDTARSRIKQLTLINPKFSAKSVKNYLGMLSDKSFLEEYLDTVVSLGLPEQ